MRGVGALRGQVAAICLGEVHPGGDLLRHLNAEGPKLPHFVRVVGEESDAAGAERAEHLGGGTVVPLVLAAAQGHVGFVGVQAGVLQGVGVELGVQADAPPLLTEVQQETPDGGNFLDCLAQLGSAVAALAAEHVAREALAVQPDQRRRAFRTLVQERLLPFSECEQQMLFAVSKPMERHDLGGGREAIRKAQRDGDLAADGGRLFVRPRDSLGHDGHLGSSGG